MSCPLAAHHLIGLPVASRIAGMARTEVNEVATTQQVLTSELATAYPWLVAQTFNTQMSLQFAPVDLEQQLIETVVFVADGVLRTLSLTAPHDGEQYLLEASNVVVSPGLDLLDPRPLQREGLRMVADGISESRPGFLPLQFLADELQQITTQILEHRVLLNQDLMQTKPFSYQFINVRGLVSLTIGEIPK